MRTTLSLDDDVAALIERLRTEHGTGLKILVNQALRHGLREMEGTAKQRQPYHTSGVDLGRCRLSSIDDVTAVLAAGEGEAFR